MGEPPHEDGAADWKNGGRYHRGAWGGRGRPTPAHV